jgi:hypothetical protein
VDMFHVLTRSVMKAKFNHFAPRHQPIIERRAILKFQPWEPSIMVLPITVPVDYILITAALATLSMVHHNEA